MSTSAPSWRSAFFTVYTIFFKETHCKRGTLFQVGQKKSLYSAFKTLDIYTTSSLADETLRSPPCPTCCTSREETTVISQRSILVYPNPALFFETKHILPCSNALSPLSSKTHLRQVDVGDDNLVKSAGSVLAGLAGVAVGVVLVSGVAAGLPGLGAVSLANLVLTAGGGRVGAEVPAGEAESARHDREKDLWDAGFGSVFAGFIAALVGARLRQWLAWGYGWRT